MRVKLNAVQALALEAVRQQQLVAHQAQLRVQAALAAIVREAAPGVTPPTSADDVQALARPDGTVELRWGEDVPEPAAEAPTPEPASVN